MANFYLNQLLHSVKCSSNPSWCIHKQETIFIYTSSFIVSSRGPELSLSLHHPTFFFPLYKNLLISYFFNLITAYYFIALYSFIYMQPFIIHKFFSSPVLSCINTLIFVPQEASVIFGISLALLSFYISNLNNVWHILLCYTEICMRLSPTFQREFRHFLSSVFLCLPLFEYRYI